MPGLIDLGIDYRKQANDMFSQVAQDETERLNFNRKMNAERTGAGWNAAGQGVGLGTMAYQSGALGNVANTLGASKGVVDALTPKPSAGEAGGGETGEGTGEMTQGDALMTGDEAGGTISEAAAPGAAGEAATGAEAGGLGDAAMSAAYGVGNAAGAALDGLIALFA